MLHAGSGSSSWCATSPLFHLQQQLGEIAQGSHVIQDNGAKTGRFKLPWALFAYPFYLWTRSPGKKGSHYDPGCDLFTEAEGKLVSPALSYLAAWLPPVHGLASAGIWLQLARNLAGSSCVPAFHHCRLWQDCACKAMPGQILSQSWACKCCRVLWHISWLPTLFAGSVTPCIMLHESCLPEQCNLGAVARSNTQHQALPKPPGQHRQFMHLHHAPCTHAPSDHEAAGRR